MGNINGMTNIKDFDLSLIKIDKKSYKILASIILVKTKKKLMIMKMLIL